jgi:hypothetical protein
MPVKARSLVLTKSQAACLIALRNNRKIAIQAKLDLTKTAAALGTLARLGLANLLISPGRPGRAASREPNAHLGRVTPEKAARFPNDSVQQSFMCKLPHR